jgi:hypothetical protein
LVAVLGKSGRKGAEVFATFAEVELEVEHIVCVDFELTAGTEVVVAELVLCVLNASSTSVAVVVETFGCWRIAGVNSSLRNPLISFHNIVLRTVVSSNLVSVAVVVSVSVQVVSVAIFTRSTHQVEGSNAAAVSLAQINVVFNRPAEQIWSVELSWVHCR